jgi:hypothetical protein
VAQPAAAQQAAAAAAPQALVKFTRKLLGLN